MILKVADLYKSIGHKDLFEDLTLTVNEGEKIALIGRNGLGKTTLFKIITGEDTDIKGNIQIQKDTRVIMTRQEHIFEKENSEISALEYILLDIPNFITLKAKLADTNISENLDHIQEYSDVITQFSELGYYEIEDNVIASLESYGVTMEKAIGPMKSLSGGEKRFVELVRVMYSGCNLALIDEPTNHMDYIGKENFINWLKNVDFSLIVITHDRDVLKYVDRIIELKDKKLASFNGNYDSYLKQNSIQTVSSIDEYEFSLRKLEKLKKQISYARQMKFKARDKSARIREEQFQREYDELKNNLDKPSFWIDKESIDKMSDKVVDKYQKYKEKNINISQNNNEKHHKKELLKVTNLSLGFGSLLFKGINFLLNNGDKIFIKGRNGAGKSTLIKTILHTIKEEKLESTIYSGNIKYSNNIKIGNYEQEINETLLKMTLNDAIFKVYNDQKLDINDQKIKALLSQYLFDPMFDGRLEIKDLSGGQKARFQIIKMLSSKPNLLILDEPTNHLDLPSIEVMENALNNYTGAVIYISHDNYLIGKLGGEVIEIKRPNSNESLIN